MKNLLESSDDSTVKGAESKQAELLGRRGDIKQGIVDLNYFTSGRSKGGLYKGKRKYEIQVNATPKKMNLQCIIFAVFSTTY